MRCLPLLRPETVKSQPTASGFNWLAQMFADVQGAPQMSPRFLIFPGKLLERGWQPVGVRVGRERKTGKEEEESLHQRVQLDSFFSANLNSFYTAHTKNISNVIILVSHCCDNIWTFRRTASS